MKPLYLLLLFFLGTQLLQAQCDVSTGSPVETITNVPVGVPYPIYFCNCACTVIEVMPSGPGSTYVIQGGVPNDITNGGFFSTNPSPVYFLVTAPGTYHILTEVFAAGSNCTTSSTCVGPSAINFNLVTCTPPSAPIASATPQSVCLGASSTLSAMGCSGTLSWYTNPAGTGTPLSSTTVTPSITTTYYAFCTVAGCRSAASSVTVNVVSPSTITVSGGGTICEGQSVNLSASGGGPYVWSPSTDLSCTNCPNPIASPSTSTTYTVTSNGVCTSTANVNVNVTAISLSVPTSICQNAPSFTVSATPSGGSFTLDGAANFGFVNPSSLSVGTHTICYTNSGCSTCETFTVNTAPSIGLFTGASSVCAGQSVPLFLAVSGGTNWSVSPSSSISPSSGVSTGATINLSASPTSSLTYTLTVENPSTGCQTTGTKGISVNPLPVVSISGAGCINQATSFTLSASGATSYLWTASPGPNPIPNNLSSITVNPSVATTYTVVGTSTGCNDAEFFTTPTCFPVEFLSFSGDVLANGSHHLEWNVSENQVSHYEVERRQGSGDFEKITSLNSNPASQGHYSHDIQVPQAGISMYRIKVVDMDGSISYSENMVSLASNSLWELKIYPNPVKDVLHMEVKTSGEYEVQIFNSLGELVYFTTKSSEDGTFFLDCSNWAVGIYECKVSSEYGEEVRKLVVE